MKVDIFIKSYAKDFPLLKYALMSLEKNVSGYDKLIIYIPMEDYLQLCNLPSVRENKKIHIVVDKEEGEGYLFQQWCKMSSWKFSDANYIMFGDSDVIFNRPIDLQDYIKDGKPEILYTSWGQVGDAVCWRRPTEKFMKESVDFEFMRRNCLIYHRSTLENISREYPNLKEQILSSGRFSEFNAIGAWAFKNEREKYKFINTEEGWEYTPPKAEQLWSWANKNGDETHQEEYKRTIDTINKALDLNITEL